MSLKYEPSLEHSLRPCQANQDVPLSGLWQGGRSDLSLRSDLQYLLLNAMATSERMSSSACPAVVLFTDASGRARPLFIGTPGKSRTLKLLRTFNQLGEFVPGMSLNGRS